MNKILIFSFIMNSFLVLLLCSTTTSYTIGTSTPRTTSTLSLLSFGKISPATKRAFFPAPRGGSTWSESRTTLSSSTETSSAVTTSSVNDFISEANIALLSQRGRAAIENLILHDMEYNGAQKHVYSNWPEPGIDDEGKIRLAEQVSLACVGKSIYIYGDVVLVSNSVLSTESKYSFAHTKN